MNNSELPNSANNNGQYHATYNLNTAMENSQGDFNDAMDVNIVNNNTTLNSENSNGSFQNNFQEQFSQDNIQNFDYQTNVNIPQDTAFNAKEITNLNTGDSTLMNNNLNQVNSYQSDNVQNNGNTFVPTVESHTDEVVSQEYSSTVDSANVNYAPVMEKNIASNKIKLSLSKEITYMFVIVLVLALFLLLMPYIYDFFRNLSFGLIR